MVALRASMVAQMVKHLPAIQKTQVQYMILDAWGWCRHDPEGWYREGGGRGIQDGEHVYTYG